jgi:Reverse transcriptase (RNA-dependent DNA polymerase)
MLTSGVFPNSLKISKITPIFKDGNRQNVANYRPIAILPVVSKVFEKVIKNRLTEYLDKGNIINKNQYGFQKNSSTSAAVINLVSGIISGLDGKKNSLIIY